MLYSFMKSIHVLEKYLSMIINIYICNYMYLYIYDAILKNEFRLMNI